VLAARKLEIAITITIVVLDQITKAMVRPALALHESIQVIPGFLDLTRVHNTGAAFGMLNGVDFPMKTVVLSLVAMIALGGVAWYAVTVSLAAPSVTSSTGPLRGTCWTSWTPIMPGGISGHSTSRMPPLRSA
jgi:signal peptidase II